MKQKTIDIPIYGCKLTMILAKDLPEIGKKYKIKEDLSNFGAFTYKHESEYRHYLVVFQSDWRPNVVHEIVHIVNHIYSDCFMQLDRKNDEPQAYLSGWLYEQIDKFLLTFKSE